MMAMRGTKDSTVPTPARTPSTVNDMTQSGAPRVAEPRRHDGRHRPGDEPRSRVHERARHSGGELEDSPHDGEEGGQPEPGVEEHRVEAVGERQTRIAGGHRRVGDRLDPVEQVLRARQGVRQGRGVQVRFDPTHGGRRHERRGDRVLKFRQPLHRYVR